MDEQAWIAIRQLEELDGQPQLQEPLYRISADTGLFLNTLVRLSKAIRILEVGASSGYSGVFLADAARANGGMVTTCELSSFKVQLARQTYEKAGLSHIVTLIEGDARQTTEQLSGPWDFVFIDAWKDDYAHYFSAVWPKVIGGGAIVADNIISHAKELGIKAYLDLVRATPHASSVTVPIGSGVEFTYKLH